MLTDKKFIKEIMSDFQNSTTNVFYGGLACIAIGFPIVTFYNVWSLHTSLIITLVGWLTLIKGLMLVGFPTYTTNMYKGFLVKENKAHITWGILIVAIIFLYLGYLA